MLTPKMKDFFTINTKILPIKLAYFTVGFGTSLIWPYQTLQMNDIGLDYGQISIIVGAVQVIAFVAAPLIGFTGDKIGYKTVISVLIVLLGVSGTSLDLTPRFREHIRNSTVSLVKAENSSGYDYQIQSILWPPPDCQESNVTQDICMDSPPIIDESFWFNITEYLVCPDDVKVKLDPEFVPDSVNVTHMQRNGTFCQAEVNNGSEPDLTCFIQDHPRLPRCYSSEGSQALTFWVYFLIRTVFQITLNCGYALLDGTALNYVKQYNCDYSFILLWNLVAAAISPTIAGAIIKESTDPLVETNYSLAYYLMDGALVLTLVCTFFLKVVMEKAEDGLAKDLKILFFNPATCTFLFMNLFLGLGWGAADAFLSIYLRDYLGASYQLIGIGTSIALGSGVPVLPIAKYVINKFGSLNIIYMAITVTGLRLVMYAFITLSPPYHYLALSTLEFLCLTLQWIACVYYINQVCPESVVGTFVATVGAAQNVLGRAVGGIIAGQLVETLGMSIPAMFNAIGISSFVGGTSCYIFYRLFCKKFEQKLKDSKIEGENSEKTENLKLTQFDNGTTRNIVRISRM